MRNVVIIGPGRVGHSFFDAIAGFDVIEGLPHWSATVPLGRSDDPAESVAIAAADLVLITVPDRSISHVAATVPVGPVVAHCSGALGLAALAPHTRVGSIHPLMTIPNRETGSIRLRRRCPFVVEGNSDSLVMLMELVEGLEGQVLRIDPDQRSLYHCAAVVASNHIVTLLAQVERLAGLLDLDPRVFGPLTEAAIEDVGDLGPSAGLTGPAVRADWSTIAGHLAALPPSEAELYEVVARAAARLGGHQPPEDLRSGA